MSNERIYAIDGFQQPADGEPIRSVITESLDAAVIAWYVKPGQSIHPHRHPDGQDTWVILSGRGHYQYNQEGDTKLIRSGDVVVARRGDVHGVFNDGTEPLEFISVVSPGSAGYEPLTFLP
jgi:quercetin dioxygenase-like cupin family protein